jgi:hypothetical protein
MNIITIEQGRLIAERLLEQALLRLDVMNQPTEVICTVVGLILKC